MGGLPAARSCRWSRRRRRYHNVISYERHKENSVQLRRSTDNKQHRYGDIPSH